LIGRFGFCSGRDVNKFQDVDFKIVKEIPVLTDTCGYAVCKVINKFETETHTVFLGEVIESKMFGNNRIPMTYSYYQKVVKGV
jgi:flavin reductase (DIM6/NTAB) family NADH-FMN oxidoreductase RutF